ncbi:hypothetical protein [Kordiimonas sp.]|uniref:hypothetical protein n=1 Tax=Kordiimonas sp. TaxID=1970157 RepID=UPI003B52FC94
MADKQICLRVPARLATQFDAAAKKVGLSRNRWAMGVLSRALHDKDDKSTEQIILRLLVTNSLMLDTIAAPTIGDDMIKRIKERAKKIAIKWGTMQ